MEWLHGPVVYLGIVLAAIVEGEIAYVAASTLVAQGHLNPLGVVLAGTVGAGQRAYVTISNKAEGSAPLSVVELARSINDSYKINRTIHD